MHIHRVRVALILAVVTAWSDAVQAAPAQPTIGTKEGRMYPDFLLPDLDGGFGRLSDYRGKKNLLTHFASW